MEKIDFKLGSIIYEEGDEAEYLYFIDSGQIEVRFFVISKLKMFIALDNLWCERRGKKRRVAQATQKNAEV